MLTWETTLLLSAKVALARADPYQKTLFKSLTFFIGLIFTIADSLLNNKFKIKINWNTLINFFSINKDWEVVSPYYKLLHLFQGIFNACPQGFVAGHYQNGQPKGH